MNCFAHQAAPAVGICRACGKGVCAACAADTGAGLACPGACEDRVLLLGRMVDSNARVMRTADRQVWSSGMLGVVMGVLFLALAVWTYKEVHVMLTALTGGMGLIFLGHGFFRLTAERFPRSGG
ncbi:hypothetical protein [Urbifossiella limnaea]|uniref:B box-type domain-containing protein n=1 Tax=Urbifossiella limnaea TaxID=2528023 RepID=A0A517XSW4_9BACT|nr:hypothetical protein [Urbifossiella limnaea]QDU20578.1 hypothetical protein ETAA1_25330 [Urbifossiella limnaea]